MSDKLLRKLFTAKVIRLGLDYLRGVLSDAGCSRVSDLSRAALLAAIEERPVVSS